LEGLLVALARVPARGAHADAAGRVRVVCAAPSFGECLALALSEIQRCGADAEQVQRPLVAFVAARAPGERRDDVLRFAAERGLDRVARDRQGLGHEIAAGSA